MKGRRWVLSAALLVAGLRLWQQLRGTTKTPFNEWAIGWGVTFFAIALISEVSPQAAGGLAGTLVLGDFLVNGASLFEDMTSALSTGAGFVDQPFTPTTPAAATTTTGSSSRGASVGGPVTPADSTAHANSVATVGAKLANP